MDRELYMAPAEQSEADKMHTELCMAPAEQSEAAMLVMCFDVHPYAWKYILLRVLYMVKMHAELCMAPAEENFKIWIQDPTYIYTVVQNIYILLQVSISWASYTTSIPSKSRPTVFE
jgi:hypothetical protein